MNRTFFFTPRPVLLVVTVMLIVLTANVMENWWANRENNLFSNGRWIIGKDTGKFLFYTYQFMFDPLKENKVKLNSSMGYQELLYHQAETDAKRLHKLTFDMVVGGDTYIWVLLRREGQRAFACRFSYRRNYPAGIFTFDRQGKMVEHIPFSMPDLDRSARQSAELELKDGRWLVKIDGEQVGTAPDPAFKNGYFGFRGSGLLRQRNSIGPVQIEWQEAGRRYTEYENFSAPATTRSQWLYILLCATIVVALRFLRSWSLGCCLPCTAGRSYLRTDIVLALLLLGLLTLLPVLPPVTQLGVSLLLLEICSFAVFAWLIHVHGLQSAIPRMGIVAFMILASVLAALSLYRHGEWAGRKQYAPASAVAAAHPGAFIQYPPPVPTHSEILKAEPFTVSFGYPFATGDAAFNQQEMFIDFIMPSGTTFDISLQQQSFFTRGDTEGEPLPMQRRLVRLSTVDHVSWGVATQTGRQPEPFIPLQGTLQPDQSNTIKIRSTEEGLQVTLNGRETRLITSMPPLGYGETVLMTFEQPVTVNRLEIRASGNQAAREHFLPFLGLLALPVIALAGGLLFSLLGGSTPTLACAGAVAAAFPLFGYLTAILFVDPVRLSLMTVDRVTFFDFALAASAWSLLYWVPLHGKRIRQPAIPVNVFLVLFIACIALLMWDLVLPAEHPLKSYFAAEHINPGELVESHRRKVPWYASNRRIGGNIFVWKQQFEGRRIPPAREPGHIRVFVLGGSQAWGSGAKSTRDTFSGLLDQSCREEGWPAEVLNAGSNGAGISTVHDVFFGILLRYDPDIVILDIGLNDSAALRGRKNIGAHLALFRKIAQTCAARDIDLILVQEPMSREGPFRPHRALYKGFADISREFGFWVVDPRPVLAKAELMEMIWWDVAHLAPRGHTIMADTIFPVLKESIEKRLQMREN